MKESEDKIYSFYETSILKYLNIENGSSILDIGCGSGDLALSMKEDNSIVVDGITISPAEAIAASSVLDNCYCFDLENGLPRETLSKEYDIVIMSHVLEHICYPESLLRDLQELPNKDLKIAVAIPNLMHYRYRLKILMGKFDYEESGIMDYTHFRWYTFKSASDLFIQNGFNVERTGYSIWLPFGRILNKIPNEKVKDYLKNLFSFFSKELFAWEMIFILTLRK